MLTVFTERGRFLNEDNDRGGDGPEDRPNDRCLGVSIPLRFAAASSSATLHRIVQSPDHVSIYYEHGHLGGAYRHIPLDGRPHLPDGIRQHLGDARGRWEGDTLVVDTTNFTDKTNYEGSRENLHLVERFTADGPGQLIYQLTVDDATVFTRPWTVEIPMTQLGQQGEPDLRVGVPRGQLCDDQHPDGGAPIGGAAVIEKRRCRPAGRDSLARKPIDRSPR